MESAQSNSMSGQSTRSKSRETTTQERRGGYRARVVHDLDLESEMRCSKNKVWLCRALNLSLNGILLEFPKDKIPMLHVDEKISVKLCCHEDVVWVPGVVRHRRGNRVGVCFPEFMHVSAKSTEQIIARILRAVERGLLRQQAR